MKRGNDLCSHFLSALMCQRTVRGGRLDCETMSLALFPLERDIFKKGETVPPKGRAGI